MRRPTWRAADVRLLLVGAVLVLAWIAIGYRLFLVQGADAASFAQRGFDQRVRHEEIEPDRGTIFDRDGVELVISVEGRTLVVDPSLVGEPWEAAMVLAPLVGGDIVDLSRRFDGNGRFAYVARRLEQSEADAIAVVIDEHDLAGFFFLEEPLRVYPGGPLAAHTLGLTSLDDNRGIEGLELVLDDALSGKPGKLIVERDPSGRAIPQGEYVIEPAEPGADVVLTLDREIQFAVERALEDAVFRTGAVSGSVVVLDPATGEVLAMASAPGFDPNQRRSLDPDVVQNGAVTRHFEPGSTLKVITVAAAIEEAVVTPGTVLEVPQRIERGPEDYSDHGSHPTVMTVADIFARSSNVGTILIQERLGNDLHYQYLDAFGLGRPASIDFAGELPGKLDHVSDWCPTACGPSAAIGYGVSATTLQMAAIFATIANDGEWIEPHVVARIIDADGNVVDTEPRRRNVISPPTARTMRRLLARVVEQGTGWRAALTDFDVGGKTGTTNKFLVEEGRYSEDETVAAFVGLAPVDRPRVVIAVVLDTPRGLMDDGTELKFGGASAAPVFAEIARAALHQLGVAPEPPAEHE